MVPELWSAKDRLFCHFEPFFVLLPTTRKMKILKKRKKLLEISSFYTSVPWITIIWCMVPAIWSVTDRIFCHFGTFFALLPEDIIILHKSTTNHMLHCSWYMMHNRCNFYFLFWAIFCRFKQKNKNILNSTWYSLLKSSYACIFSRRGSFYLSLLDWLLYFYFFFTFQLFTSFNFFSVRISKL